MIIQFKAVSPVTLGDDLAQLSAGVRWTVKMEAWGLTCRVQEEDLPEPNGGSPFLKPLGNVKGPLVFVARRSFDTFAAGVADFASKLALVNVQDSLVLMPYGNGAGQQKLTYANTVFESVQRSPDSEGVKWIVRYQFRIGAQTVTTL